MRDAARHYHPPGKFGKDVNPFGAIASRLLKTICWQRNSKMPPANLELATKDVLAQ